MVWHFLAISLSQIADFQNKYTKKVVTHGFLVILMLEHPVMQGTVGAARDW
jgi:hypothetical protein